MNVAALILALLVTAGAGFGIWYFFFRIKTVKGGVGIGKPGMSKENMPTGGRITTR